MKQGLGGNVRLILSGAAPLASHVEEYLRVVTCSYVLQGYGISLNSINLFPVKRSRVFKSPLYIYFVFIELKVVLLCKEFGWHPLTHYWDLNCQLKLAASV